MQSHLQWPARRTWTAFHAWPFWFLLTIGFTCLTTSAVEASVQALPPPAIHPHSTEICMNSRISYHGGWSGTATDQMIGDVLHAAAQAPITGSSLQLYVATAQNLYRYEAATHSLILHQPGDARSDATAAFEVGFSADSYLDAGMAMHLAQLESIAQWTGTTGQLASCPRGTATEYANSHWNPLAPIQIVICFGMRDVAGFTSTLVALSSDGSLSNPATDGPVYLDDALAELGSDSPFSSAELDPTEISQLLWASYGCNDHRASWIPGTAGLVCPSGLAAYYLTGHVYVVRADGVYRYHPRQPPGTDATSRDHRVEQVSEGDTRSALGSTVPRLPDAPLYLVLCLDGMGQLPELEVGFVAVGAMLEASSIGLHGSVTAGLSTSEQDAIHSATGIPSGDAPMAIVSLGHPSVATGVESPAGAAAGMRLWIVNQPASSGQVMLRYLLRVDAPVGLTIYDVFGHRVKRVSDPPSGSGLHTVAWDCRNDRGGRVPSGVYFCRVSCAGQAAVARALVIR